MLRIKQADGLDFSTVPPTSPLPPLAMMPVFHEVSRAERPSQQAALSTEGQGGESPPGVVEGLEGKLQGGHFT
jgi:hypothetical protein